MLCGLPFGSKNYTKEGKMKNDKTLFTEELFDWAYIKNFKDVIQALANMAEPESWQYTNHPSPYSDNPILENYLKYTYKKISKERKIAFDKTDTFCCFNTGLVTLYQEQIYIEFKENVAPGNQFWMYKGLFRKGEQEAINYGMLPEMASYFDDPVKLVYDTRKNLIVNYEHIISDNRGRFPSSYSSMSDYQITSLLKGIVESTQERVKRNYKIAVPQYFFDSIQLLLPLCLSDPTKADLALVVEDFGTCYRAATCLTLDMALNNARQLTRPDTEWLRP
jgi:hypothetical protein